MIKNYSQRGWRLYVIPKFLKIGGRKISLLEKHYDIEVLVEGDLVYIKDKYNHDFYNELEEIKNATTKLRVSSFTNRNNN